ncbi:hypothetical protein EBL87_15150 [Cereibacter sphaeroides]|nr:hypothetical protein EBL87_15150 [Cereibacter sphaeroides]
MTKAAQDVLSERARQISVEGWTPEHDDEHDDGQMALAAATFACASTFSDDDRPHIEPDFWPWDRSWLKLTTPRRDLVKAGALILAEIERLDRAEARANAAEASA